MRLEMDISPKDPLKSTKSDQQGFCVSARYDSNTHLNQICGRFDCWTAVSNMLGHGANSDTTQGYK